MYEKPSDVFSLLTYDVYLRYGWEQYCLPTEPAIHNAPGQLAEPTHLYVLWSKYYLIDLKQMVSHILSY